MIAMSESRKAIADVFADDPMLGVMWEEYELCRAQQWIHFTQKSKDGKKEYPIHAAYPTHIANWPAPGSVHNQPYIYVKVFRAFLEGEREGTMRKIETARSKAK